MAKTSQQWWDEVKVDQEKFNGWLIRQFRGEVTASRRITEFAAKYAPDVQSRKILLTIAAQEVQHAEWVLGLLKTRGIEPEFHNAEKRYWKETLPEIKSFKTGAAVGAHAERMRLQRIMTIVDDVNAPEDVREIFARILKDELFHERAFREMAGPEAMKETLQSHNQGLKALGLEP